ncbi:triosephosphate isomerase [Parvibaculum indicum]|uniref:triose-phosphate isomerase n=1 Tax=Parvibaculum indicum TaxID=562969 RepID=UPI00141DFBA7|nr:triose-phosphate isomerase [Parvibaculum indicum]NIJ42736.1 triosephosphate isomerase [Parvibaculum indicum]
MARRIKPLIAGNWKMNGLRASKGEVTKLARKLARGGKPACDVLICPPATIVGLLKETAKGSPVAIGGQDCHAAASGAHTGDVSAEMLKDLGARYVIVGHSERRADHGETDKLVRAKAETAHRAGLTAIVCVGETEAERDEGAALKVIRRQLKGSLPDGIAARTTVVAYEPVWAIGTGRTPTTEDVAKVHKEIRKQLVKRFGDEGEKVRILYGGSVKPSNAAELLAVENVNGALVGGASLKADDFYGIVAASA